MITVRKSIKINVESALIYLIMLLTLLIALSNIVSFQVNTSPVWLRIFLVSQIAVTVLDIFYLLFSYIRKRSIVLSSLKFFLYVIYILFVSLFVYSPSAYKMLASIAWPLTYVVYYLHFREKNFTNSFRKCLVFCHLTCCLVLVRTVLTMSSVFTNAGPVYHVISYLPMVLLICNKKERILLSVFASLLVLMTAKRAGFITLIMGYSGYFFLKSIQFKTYRKKIQSLFGIIVLALIASYFIITLNEHIIDRLNRIEIDQGSGRLIIWESVLYSFLNSPLFNKLLGHGLNSVPTQIMPFGKPIFAHNSYLETLYDFGIIGLIGLLFIVFTMFKFLLRLIREKDELAPTAFFAMSIVLIFSSVSYFFEESNYIMMVVTYLGAIQGIYKKKHSNFVLSKDNMYNHII